VAPPVSRPASDLGGEQVEGRRAVLELVRAGKRTVRAVYVSQAAASDERVAEIMGRAGNVAQVVPPERIERLARSDVHQGVVATAAPLRATDLDQLVEAKDAFLVALDGITDPRNFGAILRSAETAGATGVIVPRHRAAHVTPVVAKDERGDRPLYELDLADQPIVVVLGAEGKGLARLTRDRCDVLVRIPMYGQVASLNVAAAATLACHEIARRRHT